MNHTYVSYFLSSSPTLPLRMNKHNINSLYMAIYAVNSVFQNPYSRSYPPTSHKPIHTSPSQIPIPSSKPPKNKQTQTLNSPKQLQKHVKPAQKTRHNLHPHRAHPTALPRKGKLQRATRLSFHEHLTENGTAPRQHSSFN